MTDVFISRLPGVESRRTRTVRIGICKLETEFCRLMRAYKTVDSEVDVPEYPPGLGTRGSRENPPTIDDRDVQPDRSAQSQSIKGLGTLY